MTEKDLRPGETLEQAIKAREDMIKAERALKGGVIVFPSALGKTTNLLK